MMLRALERVPAVEVSLSEDEVVQVLLEFLIMKGHKRPEFLAAGVTDIDCHLAEQGIRHDAYHDEQGLLEPPF